MRNTLVTTLSLSMLVVAALVAMSSTAQSQVDAVRRLECDAHAGFGHDDVKVASKWMLHRVLQFGLALRTTLRTSLENVPHRTSPTAQQFHPDTLGPAATRRTIYVTRNS